MSEWEVHIGRAGDVPDVAAASEEARINNDDAEFLELDADEARARVPKEMIETYREVLNPGIPFRIRVRRFLTAQNKAGRIWKSAKDFALLFAPKWVAAGYDHADDFIIEQIIGGKPTMAQSNGFWQWLKDRAKEPSTYQGLAVVLGVAGASVDPEALEMIGAGVISVIGGIQMIKKEKSDNE